MQYNTIRQYQEGGATRRALGQAFIGRGVMEAQEELEEEAKKAEKEGKRRGLLGTLGSIVGTYAIPALATAFLGPVGLVGGALLKGAGAGIGRGLGETLGGVGAEDVSEGSTGFLAKDFSTLKDYQQSLGEDIGGRALGQAGATALLSLGTEGFKQLAEAGKYKVKGALGKFGASRYSDPVTADTGAVFDEASGMYGDVNVPDFDTSPLDFGTLSKTELDYLSSLPKATETGSLNRALDMSQTAQSQAMQTSNQMQKLIDYLGGNQISYNDNLGVVPFGRNAGLPYGSFAGGGLFNPMKTGRRIF